MNILSKIEEYLKTGKEFVVVTVADVKGSAPQVAGAKMIVFQDKSIEGTIGGGESERVAIKDACQFMRLGTCGLKEYTLTKKKGMLCGGTMKVFFEAFRPSKKLIMVGAGHIGEALYKLADMLGFQITVVDNRKEYANKKRFPKAVIKVGLPQNILKKLKIDTDTYITIATHNHAFDLVSLKAVVCSGARYIGMIGSRVKIKENFRRLMKEGISKKALGKVYSPIGLNLGGNTPVEIAISIAAQMIAVENSMLDSLKFEENI